MCEGAACLVLWVIGLLRRERPAAFLSFGQGAREMQAKKPAKTPSTGISRNFGL
jgi:hypothetical protein